MAALLDAESGRAQMLKGDPDIVIEMAPEIPADLELEEGEVLRLPPTPTQALGEEKWERGQMGQA